MGRIWRNAIEGSAPWARDNIAWSCAMAVSPAVAIAVLSRHGRADFSVVWLTLWLYAGVFILYYVYRLIRGVLGVRSEDRAEATARAMLLCTFEAQAQGLVNRLEEVEHHWRNSGETLLRPLTVNTTKNAGAVDLQGELHDFKLLYGEHMQRVGLDAPYFTSNALIAGFPSGREYPIVLHDLKEHAKELLEMATDFMAKR